MAWTYESSGAGSDTRKIASMINAHNLMYQWRRDSTLGITARETAFNTQFGQTLGVTNNDFLARLQDAVNNDRDDLPGDQLNWYNIFQNYVVARGSEEFADVAGIGSALDGLTLDMYTNSKSVEPSVISITPGSNTHVFHSEIHINASRLNFLAGNTTVQLVEKVSDLSSETLTFEVSTPQGSGGTTLFNVYGEEPAATADVAGGQGRLGSLSGGGWDDGGVLENPNAESTAGDSLEFAGNWQCFDAISSSRFTTAPETALATRNVAAGEPYRGESDIKWIGDDANATLYIAQILNNPLLDLDETAWGTDVNDSPLGANGVSLMENNIVVCSFYYKGVPTGYTLTPELLAGGNTRTADETIQGVTSDGSSTWRLAVFAFFVRAGDTDGDLVFAMKLTNGGGNTSSSIDVQIQRISLQPLTGANNFGNLNFIAVPSIAPLAAGATDTFALGQTSEGKWQKFFTRWAGASTVANRNFALQDVYGQAYQLPSNSTETELESLITIEDK